MQQQPADYARRLLSAQPRLRAYVRSLVFNPSEVDDIMQDVATFGWEKFASFDPQRPFDAWLLGIARNLVLQHFEKQKRRAVHLSDTTLQQLEAVAFEASSKTNDLEQALETCLTKLEPGDYRMVQLRYAQDANNRTVAQQLDLSESKVSRALNRIYAQLLLCIKQQDRSLVVQP